MAEVVLAAMKTQKLKTQDGDVLALASKIVSYSQNRIVALSEIKPSAKAKTCAKQFSLTPEFAELVLREAETIYGGVQRALLTMKDGALTPNAGIDNKNAPRGCVVLWPARPKKWASEFREEMKRRTGKRIGVMVVDSGLAPLRIGTCGLALAVAGFKPIRDHRGHKDLSGRRIAMTRHAVADDLASVAHLMMGEAAEKTPAVLIRGAPLESDDGAYDSRDMMMPASECLFMSVTQAGVPNPAKAEG